ncbi:MAG: DNA-formamidopyrimidine glycosylase [Candidatus Omnitrophica bacterium]|nr:DNA-formamidopyrimidine glycosylase [Candidatus Omnitrophota bacterium]MBL7210721.1 DNA-formamidopyrimidine glycosylase [Candidatus Omnitrophota bacterium]
MPELPEVETIKRELQKVVVGKKISGVCVHHPRVIRQPSPAQFRKGLTGARIRRVLRKAKLLILELSNGKSLAIHLKMTGQLIYPGTDSKGARVSFVFGDGTKMDFNDQRLFAELRLLDDWRTLKFVRQLGPEPFDLDVKQFKRMLAKKKTKIKPLLMNQAFIAGIGNLYAAESLFRARIHPGRSASSLADKEKEALFKQINKTLKGAIEHRGSSVDQYLQLNGRPGSYIKYHKVYDRRGKACFRCQTLIKRIVLGGRGTYFCPQCQK